MNPKLLRQYTNILDEAAYQTGAQFMASRPPAAQPNAPAAGTAAAVRAGQGSKPASAPLPTTASAPGYNTGGKPAKIGNQSFGAPAGGGAKPTAPNYSAAVKSANAAFAANQAKAPQGDQTAGGKTNAAFLPGAAGGAKPAAAPTTPAPQTNALGIAPQANVPGMQTGPAEKPTPAPQTNALGIAPQANIPGSPTNSTALGAPKSAEPTNTGPMSNVNAAVSAATAAPIGGGPTSTTGPDSERGVVKGGFGQDTNLTTDSPDQISKRGPMGITLPEEDLEEDNELSELMRLSGQPMQEKAPPGAKAERMVKHIKKGYADDGKLSDKEKSIAYATAWKAHNKSDVNESVVLEAGSTLEHIIKKFKHETKNFLAGNDLDNDLYDALYDYYSDNGEMPYGVAKARDGDPYQWISNKFADEMQMHGYGRQTDMLNMPGADHELTELARLAGLSESQVAECGDMDMKQQDSMNVSTNMSSDGTKSVSISAQGDQADALLQMLKMAGMRPHDNDNSMGMTEPEVIMIGGSPDEEMMDEEYANKPEEEYQTIDSIIHQGDDLNREKEQHPVAGFTGDNPMAEEISLDEELQSLLDSVLFREEMTDVLKAEQPYKDEKTGKMVTPPKGATMPPADSPPATKTTVKK